MMTGDDLFLRNIRTRIEARPKAKHPGPWPGRAWANRPDTLDSLVDRFAAELAAVGGHTERVTTSEQLHGRLEHLRSQLNVETIVFEREAWSHFGHPGQKQRQGPTARPLYDHEAENDAVWIADIGKTFGESFITDAKKSVLEQADAGLTWADWGIAETGSVVLTTAPGRSRLVSLVPTIHIALLPATRLVATRAEVFANIAQRPGGRWPANVVLITGPSRTADIENDLSIGVHGPGHVHVFILG